MPSGLDQSRLLSRTGGKTTIGAADIAALKQFLDATAPESDLRHTGTVFDATIRRLGFGEFALRIRKPGKTTTEDTPFNGIWTYPNHWREHFNASGYFSISPVFIMAERLRRPFNWFEILALPALSKAQRRMFSEAAEFSIGMGLTVPIHTANCRPAVFTINANQSLDPAADSIRVDEKKALLLGFGFFERAAPLLHGQQLALSETDPLSVAVNDNAPQTDAEMRGKIRHVLTPFERECLAWSAAGLDSWAISERFALSEAMVHRAFEAARLKLGVATRDHAVVRALANDLIAL